MVNSYYYNGNQYVPRTSGDGLRGYVYASLASGAIMSSLPAFGIPFSKQLKNEHAQNHIYKDAFEKALEVSGLDKHGVKINPAQFSQILTDEAKGLNASYTPSLRMVNINTNKISIAGFHELGHAMNNITSKVGKMLTKARWGGYTIAGYLGYLALFSSSKPKEAPKNTFDHIRNNYGKLAFACLLPTVLEEGMASYKGVQLAKKTGLSEAAIKNMKKLYSKALLTYAGYAAATGFAVGATSMIMEKFTRPKKVKSSETLFKY